MESAIKLRKRRGKQERYGPGIRIDDAELELLVEEAGLELAELEALEWQHELLVLLLRRQRRTAAVVR